MWVGHRVRVTWLLIDPFVRIQGNVLAKCYTYQGDTTSGTSPGTDPIGEKKLLARAHLHG